MRCKYAYLIGILEVKYPALAVRVKHKLLFDHMHEAVRACDQYTTLVHGMGTQVQRIPIPM